MKTINFGKRRIVRRARVLNGVKEIHPAHAKWVSF